MNTLSETHMIVTVKREKIHICARVCVFVIFVSETQTIVTVKLWEESLGLYMCGKREKSGLV